MRVGWALILVLAGAAPLPADGDERPDAVFAAVAERYRALVAYEDTARVVEVVTRPDRPAHRVETQIECRLEGDSLTVRTPGAQVRGPLTGALAPSAAVESLVHRHNLWLAPHMALHFAERPLWELRAGVDQPFAAIESRRVELEGLGLERIVLRSPDPAADPGAEEVASFEFWVDPETLLVRRVRGRQVMPDGGLYETTVDVDPVRAEPSLSGD